MGPKDVPDPIWGIIVSVLSGAVITVLYLREHSVSDINLFSIYSVLGAITAIGYYFGFALDSDSKVSKLNTLFTVIATISFVYFFRFYPIKTASYAYLFLLVTLIISIFDLVSTKFIPEEQI